MKKITGIIIAKNEENMIADAIDSLSFCDEIIVIDGGSTDNTAELAKHTGAKVVQDLSQSFAERRNKGLKAATGEWILYIDADERVSPALQDSIKRKVIGSTYDEDIPAFKIARKNFYFGNHQWPTIEHLERVFKREKLKGWYGKLHESPKVDGKIGELDGFLLHYTHRDLTSMLEKTIAWSEIEAETRFASGHPKMIWWRFPRVMITTFFNSYITQKGYKAGTFGVVESIYQMFSMFITYARLWELQEKKHDRKD